MKKLIIALAAIVMISSIANANVLLTGNTLGAGKIGYLGALAYDMSSVANSNQYALGGALGYGVLSNLDVYLKAAYGIGSNLPASVTGYGTDLGLIAKYGIMDELAGKAPVSVAGILEYQAETVTLTTPFGSFQGVAGDIGLGVVVSKIMVPWVPYGAAIYHSVASGGATTSGIELAVGSQMLLSKTSAIIGELSYMNNSTTSVTDTEISLGYSAKI